MRELIHEEISDNGWIRVYKDDSIELQVQHLPKKKKTNKPRGVVSLQRSTAFIGNTSRISRREAIARRVYLEEWHERIGDI